jgi:hypothetical protein
MALICPPLICARADGTSARARRAVAHDRRGSAVGNEGELHSSHVVEQLGREVHGGAVAAMTYAQAFGPGLGKCDDLGDGVDWKRRMGETRPDTLLRFDPAIDVAASAVKPGVLAFHSPCSTSTHLKRARSMGKSSSSCAPISTWLGAVTRRRPNRAGSSSSCAVHARRRRERHAASREARSGAFLKVCDRRSTKRVARIGLRSGPESLRA